MRSRIMAPVVACLLVIGFGSFLTANSASASPKTETQWCFDGSCLNAWNGGPYVNVYSPNVGNNYFSVVPDGQNVVIVFEGNGNDIYDGSCIGDLNNSPTDARAGLSSCGQWGYLFTATTQNCVGTQEAFHNNHWGGWLAPAGFGDGDAFYLNNPVETCFTFSEFTYGS